MAAPPKVTATTAELEALGTALADRSKPVHKRFRLIFTLRNIGGPGAVHQLARAFADDSALLKHEIAFVMGQMREPSALPYLNAVLGNEQENSMVRHEAGEALGAIGLAESLAVLERYCKDPLPEVAETCHLAIDRIRYYQKRSDSFHPHPTYQSVDPAPATKRAKSVGELQAKLMDPKRTMFKRYRALFALRNIGTKEAAQAMLVAFHDSSALLRHEIAYVLGQMQEPETCAALEQVLAKAGEHPMVRHEAAEALGNIALEEYLPTITRFAQDPEAPVRESCEVALDYHRYMHSNEFEYADGLVQLRSK